MVDEDGVLKEKLESKRFVGLFRFWFSNIGFFFFVDEISVEFKDDVFKFVFI